MGSDNLFKKRREKRKERKYEYKKPKANSYLIVTEGTQTEPNYFNGIKTIIEQNLGGNVDIVELPIITISGEGRSTLSLINETDRIVNQSRIIYQNIWIVFDKDDFPDFDNAIEQATHKGYKVAWSNQSFEYWLYLHFYYSDVALHRDDWTNKLNTIFKHYGLNSGSYQKNDPNIFNTVNSFDGLNTAIKNAQRRMAEFKAELVKPSLFDPGTTVFELVLELKQFMNE